MYVWYEMLLSLARAITRRTTMSPATASASHQPGTRIALLALVALGLGAGLSPFFFAFYDTSLWVPIGLGLTVVCAIVVMTRPLRPGGPAVLALIGLFGLGMWSLISTAWAESVQNAVVDGDRWLLYGALLTLMLALARSERRAAVLLASAALGVSAVALSVLARLLGSDPRTLFLGARLDVPVGYFNGEGCLFVMGFWLWVAVAQSRRSLLAAPAAGMAALMACLALLTQSRGSVVAMVGSLVAVLALVPGRARRAYLLLVLAGAVALVAPRLLEIYEHGASAGSVSVGFAQAAGRTALLAALGAGAAWGVLTGLWERQRAAGTLAAPLRTAAAWLLAIPVLAALALGVGFATRLEGDVRTQWRAFTHLVPPPGAGGESSADSAVSSRLLFAGGTRYDQWRIAWRIWREHPLVGVGAGNYPQPYYELSATGEDIKQPHSIELQTLSELGLAGALLLCALLAGVGWGMARSRRAARRSSLARAVTVAAVGAFSAWLVQTSADWMHLLPGLTAIAIAAVAALTMPRARLREPTAQTDLTVLTSLSATGVASPPRRRGARFGVRVRLGEVLAGRTALALGVSAVLVTLVVAGASLSRQGAGDLYRARAAGELTSDPAAALADANRSLEVDSDDVQTYYVKAAAIARLGSARGTEAVLRQALAREPRNFVTWSLLGDVAVRRHRFALARRDYLAAHRLNPRNITLQGLARDPALALR
jgi:O-antigen ligase